MLDDLSGRPFVITRVSDATNRVHSGWGDTPAEETVIRYNQAYIVDVINGIPDQAEDIHKGPAGTPKDVIRMV